MNLVSVSCNHCGASLEFPQKTKFVTCSYCQSKLKVETHGSAHYTQEILEEVREVADDVEVIKLQNRLERLDREWTEERKKFIYFNQYGRELPLSTTKSSQTGFVIGIVIASIWILFSFFISLAISLLTGVLFVFIMPLFGVGVIILLVTNKKNMDKKAVLYVQAKQRHDSERQALIDELNKASNIQ